MKKNLPTLGVRAAQGTAEYLVILGVVTVSALIVVGLMTGFFGNISTVDVQQNKAFWATQSLGITDAGVDANGNTFFIVTNNTEDTITLTGYVANGIDKDFNSDGVRPQLQPGAKKVIFIANQTPCNGNLCSLENLSFKYTSSQGLGKRSNGNDLLVEKANKLTHAMFTASTLVCANNEDVGLCGGGGDSIWVQDGNNIYYDVNGNIGIGTSNPQAWIDINSGYTMEVIDRPIIQSISYNISGGISSLAQILNHQGTANLKLTTDGGSAGAIIGGYLDNELWLVGSGNNDTGGNLNFEYLNDGNVIMTIFGGGIADYVASQNIVGTVIGFGSNGFLSTTGSGANLSAGGYLGPEGSWTSTGTGGYSILTLNDAFYGPGSFAIQNSNSDAADSQSTSLLIMGDRNTTIDSRNVTIGEASENYDGTRIKIDDPNNVIWMDDSVGIIKVGIGTSAPTQKLEVSNVMRLTPTDSPGACDASAEGSMYMDDSLNEPCFCNGTAWRQFDGGGTC